MRRKNFISMAIYDLFSRGISITFEPKDFVKQEPDNIDCSGYYDHAKKHLVIATAGDIESWFEIFVHEYCHSIQSSEGYMDNYDDTSIWKWLEHKIELSKEDAKEQIHSTIKLEADCEKRVLSLIDKYNLPIDKEEYCRKANAYLMFYVPVLNLRLFGKGDYAVYGEEDVLERIEHSRILDFEELINPPQWFIDDVEKRIQDSYKA